MTKFMKWRLKELPNAEGVASLVKEKIITQDEARQILFAPETPEEEFVGRANSTADFSNVKFNLED